MANILYTTKSGTLGYTGVTPDTWFQIIEERNKMAVDFTLDGAPQIATTEYSPTDTRDELFTTIGYIQDAAIRALGGLELMQEKYSEPKSVYTISDTTGNTIYNITDVYDRIYLVNNSDADGNEVILPSLDFFKDNQKLTFVSHPNSVFRSQISWYDDNGTKNYINAVISKDNPLEFDYWQDIDNLVIRGSYSGYTFDENYYIGYKEDTLGYGLAKYNKSNTLVWSFNPAGTGATTNIKSDKAGNIFTVAKFDSTNTNNNRVNKLNATGGTVWTLVRTGYDIKTMVVDSFGETYLSGGGNQIGVYGVLNMEKISTTGIRLWEQFYPGTVKDIALSKDETILYVVGAPTGYTGTPNSLKVYDTVEGIYITQIDVNELNDLTAIDILSNNNIVVGGVAVSGVTHSIIEFDGTVVASMDFGYTVNDIVADKNGNFYVCGNNFITKYDSLGNEIWSGDHGAELRQMSLDADGNVYAVGNISETYIGRVFASSDGTVLANIPGSGVSATAIHVK